ncbi:hypothetical protein [Martelella sp. FOR1707]
MIGKHQEFSLHPHFRRALTSAVAALALTGGLAASDALAAGCGLEQENIQTTDAESIYWNGTDEKPNTGGYPKGGDGTWNTQLTNWTNHCSTLVSQWDETKSWAHFGTTGGNVTLAEPITFKNLSFDVSDYVIVGPTAENSGNPALSTRARGSTSTIAVNPTQAAQINVDIESFRAGPYFNPATLLVTGGGTLIFNNDKTYLGDTSIAEGTGLVLGGAGYSSTLQSRHIHLKKDASLQINAPGAKSLNFTQIVTSDDETANVTFGGRGSYVVTGDLSGFQGVTAIDADLSLTSQIAGEIEIGKKLSGLSGQQVGATVSGTGMLGGFERNVYVNEGVLSPGNDTEQAGPDFGTMQIRGNLVLSPDSTLLFGITRPDSADNDKILVHGGINSLATKIRIASLGQPDKGDYVIMQYTGPDPDTTHTDVEPTNFQNDTNYYTVDAKDGVVTLHAK